MLVRWIATFVAVCVVCAGGQSAAQATAQTAPGEADPGVRPTRMIDRAEVRVSRVELQPGATRRVHTHDDVEYHLWIPIEGQLQITIGTEPPVAAASGQAFFMQRGTPHGFKNVGTTRGAVVEVFIKQKSATGGAAALLPAAALELAGLGRRP
jgi:quercetin dioxygenase-like cupin family protein